MKSLPTQDPLELEVVNFGPIAKAKIDLRPLTVFIGPSNSGKSYLAILIYALHKYFDAKIFQRRRRFFRRHEISEETINKLAKWAKKTLANNEKLDSGNIILPDMIVDLIRSGFNTQGNIISNEIVRCFGIDEIGALIRKRSKGGSRIVLRNTSSNDSATFESQLTIKRQKTEFLVTIPEDMLVQINVSDESDLSEHLYFSIMDMVSTKDKSVVFSSMRFIDSLASLILPQIAGPLRLPAFYLPASRTGVMHAHRSLVGGALQSASMAGLRTDTHTPMLSGVLADFLEQLIQFASPSRFTRKRSHDLGKRIEEAILEGSVRINKSEAINYPIFTYRPKGWSNDLDLMNTSSMVSELAPVVLYLRHRVRSNDVLIVEEPESHLHPAMQVEFTRQLAALVRSGIRVIVTTHSEWILEELANLVQLSKLPKTKQKKIDGGDFALSLNQVGAWLFQPKNTSKGSVVEEVKLDDSGLYQSGFQDVSVALYNKWAEISDRIEEGQ